jgi:hypothetical protein
MDGHGTLQEVASFAALISDVRERSGRDLLVVLIHHENRAGTSSGQWEPAGDTLLHLSCPTNGKTIMHFEKARWHSGLHGKTLKLNWGPGETFVSEDERDHAEEVCEYVAARLTLEPKECWRTAREIAAKDGIAANGEKVEEVLQGDPDTFISRSGDDAKEVGRSPNATVWSVA